MKKVLFAVFTALMLAALTLGLSACGGRDDTIVLRAYNWGWYHDPDIEQLFYEETGIRIEFEFFPTNQEMYNLIVHQGAEFDILFPSDYMVERLILEGRVAPLNWDNIPNARYIHHYFNRLEFDPQGRYAVPYKWGLFGIVYNTAMVADMQDSWGMIFDEALAAPYADSIYMYDAARDSVGSALNWLGFDHNTTNLSEIHAARDLMIHQGQWVRAYLGDEIRDSMIAGGAAMAQLFSGCAFYTMYENPDLNFVVPREGTQLFIDAMVIPATSRHQAEAEMFINFMMRPDIALMNAEYVMYSPTNAAALEMLPQEWRDSPTFWPTADIVARGTSFRDLGDFRNEVYRAYEVVLMSVGR
jgi:spermidine/putrescine transport system substrate-binding protein